MARAALTTLGPALRRPPDRCTPAAGHELAIAPSAARAVCRARPLLRSLTNTVVVIAARESQLRHRHEKDLARAQEYSQELEGLYRAALRRREEDTLQGRTGGTDGL